MAAPVDRARAPKKGVARSVATTASRVCVGRCTVAHARKQVAAHSRPGLHHSEPPDARRCVLRGVPPAVTACICLDVEVCTRRSGRAAVSTARHASCHRREYTAMHHLLSACTRACPHEVWRDCPRAELRAIVQARVTTGRLRDLHPATREGKPACVIAALRGSADRERRRQRKSQKRTPHYVAGPSQSAGEYRDRPHASAC